MGGEGKQDQWKVREEAKKGKWEGKGIRGNEREGNRGNGRGRE